jgi:ABC-2 type transport system permease protein
MTPQLRSELLKLRSTRTALGLLLGLLGLVALASLLHGLALAEDQIDSRSDQLTSVFNWGQLLGSLFAALLGALSMTGEFRHGTIRPTLLITPQRGRVVAAKMAAGMPVGAAFGVLAAIVCLALGSVALEARGIDVRLDGGDQALLLAGGAVGAALWGAIGVGLGAIIRSQVPTLVGICTWLLLVEQLLVSSVGEVGRFAPGAAAAAITDQNPDVLLGPAIGFLLLALYAVAAAAAGSLVTARRDVA